MEGLHGAKKINAMGPFRCVVPVKYIVRIYTHLRLIGLRPSFAQTVFFSSLQGNVYPELQSTLKST